MYFDIDIETIPGANRTSYIDAALADGFTIPSGLTKEQAAAELGLVEPKGMSKDQVLQQWALEFGPKRAEEAGDKAWRATALDGTCGRILSIAWAIDKDAPGGLIDPANETKLIRDFFAITAGRLGDRKPYFIGHNVTWDLKFIYRRAVILGIEPPYPLPFRGRHGSDYHCTMEAWCSYGERISQDKLARALGLPGKGEMDGSKVCDAWVAGEFPKILGYNIDDVAQNIQIFRRQRFIEQPRPGIMYPAA